MWFKIALVLAASSALVSCRLSPRDTPPQARLPPVVTPGFVPFAAPISQMQRMLSQARGLDPTVLQLALESQRCAVERGLAKASRRMAVIDYSLPSTQTRMWVFDLSDAKLLFAEHVAHGKNSGENMATRFSNAEGSLQSSLGLFTAAETYDGENGYSLRMDGLEPGVNDRARERLLVIHGADYVNPQQATRQGRLGRSWGCPALRRAVAHQVIDSLKGGQTVFAYYPDSQWLGGSRFLGCNASGALAATLAR